MVDLAEAVREAIREVNFAVHGTDAIVAVPSGTPTATRIIWMTPPTQDIPSGNSLVRKEPIRSMAIRRDEIAEVPRGTIVSVLEPLGSSPDTWRVDSMDAVLPDQFRVIVVPYAAVET